MSYELVPLGDLGEIVTGSTPDTTNKDYWDGNIPWITPADLTNHEGIYFTGNLRKITEAGYKSCSTKMIPAGSIVYSTRAPIGHCAVTSFPLCTNQGFKALSQTKDRCSLRFLRVEIFHSTIGSTGKRAAFAEVNKETFENFRIPLPAGRAKADRHPCWRAPTVCVNLRRAARQLTDSCSSPCFWRCLEIASTRLGNWEKL